MPGSTAPKIHCPAQALNSKKRARSASCSSKAGNPSRTIIYCFWDGEEPALLGSTEWAEYHADELKQHAVAYFNSDGNGRGFFRAEGSHSLENFVNGVAKDIHDPETKMSVWKRVRLVDVSRATPQVRAEIRSRADLRIPALGSGSDYTVFIDHLGVASVNLGYGGEDEGGASITPSTTTFTITRTFSTPTFVYERALAQTAGTMVMRMADADILPFQFSDLADTVHLYVTQLKTLATEKHDEAKERDQEISDGVYKALYDPKKHQVPPPVEPIPPYLNFAPLDQASDDLTDAAKAFDAAYRCRRRQCSRRSERRSDPQRTPAYRRPAGCRIARGSSTCSMPPASSPATASKPFLASAKPSSKRNGRRRINRSGVFPPRWSTKLTY